MSCQEPSKNRPPDTKHPDNALDWIDRLSTHVATRERDSETVRIVSGLSEAVEQTLIEHKGMASELLAVYEQLGVVFEVTRKLSGVREETEIINLFLESLRRSFSSHKVFAVRPTPLERPVENRCHRKVEHRSHREVEHRSCREVEHRSCRKEYFADGSNLALTDWLDALISRAQEEGEVLVERPPAGAMAKPVADVMVGPVMAGDSFVHAIVLTRGEAAPEFVASGMLLLESLTMFCGDLIRNHRLVRELDEMSFALVRALVSAVDQKDEYTSGHSLRVGYFAAVVGQALGLEQDELQMLQWSALLHDVGKIGIRDDVLKKKGKLAPEEFDHIKEHPVRSHKVVKDVPQLAGALDGVLHHHEHYDGRGYPAGLAGEAIPLPARIIQVADVFDALTSDRSYRRAHSWEEALAVLEEEAGKTVDPRIQVVFDGLIRYTAGAGSAAWERLVRRAEKCPRVVSASTCERKGE